MLVPTRSVWQVDPHPGGSRVVMRFAYQATSSIRGGLFAIALRGLAPWALRRIFHGWPAELRSNSGRHAGSAKDRQSGPPATPTRHSGTGSRAVQDR